MWMALLPGIRTEAQTGVVLKTFDLRPNKLLLDPARPQLYATLPNDNSVG